MRRYFKVLKFDFLYRIFRIISVFCYFNHMNGFGVRYVDGDLYLDFSITSHCCASFVVLHDVIGLPVYIEGKTIKILNVNL